MGRNKVVYYGETIIDLTGATVTPNAMKEGVKATDAAGNLITGTMRGQTKTVTPSKSQQITDPDQGYSYLTQVTVEPVPYTETENASGGITVTIGG